VKVKAKQTKVPRARTSSKNQSESNTQPLGSKAGYCQKFKMQSPEGHDLKKSFTRGVDFKKKAQEDFKNKKHNLSHPRHDRP
jgi:hypothetical protein